MLKIIKVAFTCLLAFHSYRLTVMDCDVDEHADCTERAAKGDCIDSNVITEMQCECPISCQTFSCNASLDDIDCNCGELAADDGCSDTSIQSSCPYTCQLRQNITCRYDELPDPWSNTSIFPNKLVYSYLDSVVYECDNCLTSEGGVKANAKHTCQVNGTWLRHPDYPAPNCVKLCQDNEDCGIYESFCYEDVEDLLKERWGKCAATCNVPAQCNIGQGETNCDCGWFAKNGDCESDSNIHDNICPVTCSRRDAIVCDEPESYPHATPSSDRRYMATLTYTCDAGYVNKGENGTQFCTVNGTWLLGDFDSPDCQAIMAGCESSVTFTKLFDDGESLELEVISEVTAESRIHCAQMCFSLEDCSHFYFNNPSECRMYKFYGSNNKDVSKSKIWKRDVN